MAVSLKNFVRVYLVPGLLIGLLIGYLIEILFTNTQDYKMILILISILYLFWINRRRF